MGKSKVICAPSLICVYTLYIMSPSLSRLILVWHFCRIRVVIKKIINTTGAYIELIALFLNWCIAHLQIAVARRGQARTEQATWDPSRTWTAVESSYELDIDRTNAICSNNNCTKGVARAPQRVRSAPRRLQAMFDPVHCQLLLPSNTSGMSSLLSPTPLVNHFQ